MPLGTRAGVRFGSRGAPWTLRIVNMLREQGPLPFEKVVAEGMALVPPGRAYRLAERNRQKVYRSLGRPTERIYNKDDDKIIRSGARHLVVQSISPKIKEGKLVKYWDDERQEYMIRIGDDYETRWQSGIHCNNCGADLYSNSAHDYVACYCDTPVHIDGGFDNPRIGIPNRDAKYSNIKRLVRLDKLPKFYRLELSYSGHIIQSRERLWIEEDTQPARMAQNVQRDAPNGDHHR